MGFPQTDLNLLRIFIEVADSAGFSSAAKKLSMQRSSVSRSVASLESDLDVQLFSRTTRQVALTTAGTALYEKVAPQLASLEQALERLPEREAEPSGDLRITAPNDLAHVMLGPLFAGFVLRFPKVHVDARITNEFLDLVAERVDVALRPTPEQLPDSSMVARKLTDLGSGFYAAPSYLARAGTPRTLEETADHQWVWSHLAERIPNLPKPTRQPAVTSNDVGFTAQCAIAGVGLAVLPRHTACDYLTTGELVRILPKCSGRGGVLHLIRPATDHVPRKVSAFTDYAVEYFKTNAGRVRT